jgi:anti-sigma B factor antagonist
MSVQGALSSDFDVAISVAEGRTVVHVRGDVDIATAPRLRGALRDGQDRRRLHGTHAPVVVDLSDVNFIDASGLGALLSGVRQARRLGSDLVLRNPSPRTLRVLEVTRLRDVLAIEWVDRPTVVTLPTRRVDLRDVV